MTVNHPCPTCGPRSRPATDGHLTVHPSGVRWTVDCDSCTGTLTFLVPHGPKVQALLAAGCVAVTPTVDSDEAERLVAEFHRRLADDRWCRAFVSACTREAEL